MRKGKVDRKTSETEIALELDIDGNGDTDIDTGIGFLDHMLNLMFFHGKMDLNLSCSGDIYIDDHHTVEDIGIALGQAFKQAIGDRIGIRRYGSFTIPMDEALATVNLDISNRPFLVCNMELKRDNLGSMSTENFKEFFRAFAFNAGITLHINIPYGENDHHKIEAVFKALGRAVRDGSEVIGDQIPSSKGML